MSEIFCFSPPEDTRYVPDRSWRFEPEIAANRKQLAATYRRVRADNPAMARLLFARVKAAEKATQETVANLFFHGTEKFTGLVNG